MEEYVPVSREPLDVCAVFIKEEQEHCLETVETLHTYDIKIERDYFVDNEDGEPTSLDSNPPPDSSKTYTCEICTKQFSQKRYMTAHRQRHPEFKDLAIKLQEEKLRLEQAKKDQQFICLYCQKEFCNRSTVNRHMKIHTDDKPVSKDYICDICQKAFAHKRDVRVHLRVHTGEKPYKCKTCSKRFTQLASLQYHVQGHSKIKPYPCDMCNKQFLRRISLERHKRIHSGIRPFKCQLCEKAFTQKRHLVQHNRLHTKYKHRKLGSKFGRNKDAFPVNAITA
ncbi:zinc finger protein 468-like [Cydia pomonella]|uniref:zinc finger protein 468-like n=1 Tax=Cydia pomonella TaxID=82600 RepID=UPI002ADD3FF3|nr:zinc finger protein 468-like [Cydia pomonella]